MSDWTDATLAALTDDEKIALVAGRDLWSTVPVDRIGLGSMKVTDGPNGARGADGNHGPTSTSFPIGAAMGATWNPELIEDVGRALAHETRTKGAHVLLGPTVNIPRAPTAGRNFECYSEDPVLSGKLAAAWIRGIQSEGIAACIKHFVCNDQEHERFSIDAVVDERALREVYLEPFRIAVAEASPWSAMSAYNQINGTTASEHPLLDDVLRGEFGFDGAIISDWYGTYGPGVMSSGLDLEMPGPGRWLAPDAIRQALDAGEITMADIDRKVSHLLTLMERTGVPDRPAGPDRADERDVDRALARRVATEAMVLLTNDGALPLGRPKRIAVIGELAAATPHQGGGSSTVNAHRVVSILEGITEAVGEDAELLYTPGTWARRSPPAIDASHLEGGAFTVEYFDAAEPAGTPVRTVETEKSFLAFFGGGDEWVDHERFGVRMSGRFVAPTTGAYGFLTSAGGRLRITANGAVVVDGWDGSCAEGCGWTMDLAAGDTVDLVIEYAAQPEGRWRWMGIGCTLPDTEASIEDAVAAARQAEVAVVVAGLTHEWESEGFDRPDLALPGDQAALIEAVAEAQPNTVVVLTAGSAIEMPWIDEVRAVLHTWYGGQEVGHAVADVLFGAAEPGGRLPVTFPDDSRQHPGLLNFPGEAGTVRYGEGVYVGYRGFDQLGLTPRFPFGHGMSYTRFDADPPQTQRRGDAIRVDLSLRNVGERDGSEVVQIYGRDLGGVPRRLAAFAKAALRAGETVDLSIDVPLEHLRWWDPAESDWQAPAGSVHLAVRWSGGEHEASIDLED